MNTQLKNSLEIALSEKLTFKKFNSYVTSLFLKNTDDVNKTAFFDFLHELQGFIEKHNLKGNVSHYEAIKFFLISPQTIVPIETEISGMKSVLSFIFCDTILDISALSDEEIVRIYIDSLTTNIILYWECFLKHIEKEKENV